MQVCEPDIYAASILRNEARGREGDPLALFKAIEDRPLFLHKIMKILIAILLLLLALTITGWAVSMIHVIKVLRPDKRPAAEEVLETSSDPKSDNVDWLLTEGTSADWLKLCHSQKIAVCKEAAARFHISGKEVPTYYVMAVDTCYGHPEAKEASIGSQIILAEAARQDALRPSEGGFGLDPLDNLLNSPYPPYILPKSRKSHEQNGLDKAAGLFVEYQPA